MIFISNMGNVNGRTEYEGSPSQVDIALGLGFKVKVDVWVVDGSIFLGRGEPLHLVTDDWFFRRREGLWVRCRNVGALEHFSFYGGRFNYFWQECDDLTLTSWGYVWSNVGCQPVRGSIAFLPELFFEGVDGCRGVCSDVILRYRDEFDEI